MKLFLLAALSAVVATGQTIRFADNSIVRADTLDAFCVVKPGNADVTFSFGKRLENGSILFVSPQTVTVPDSVAGGSVMNKTCSQLVTIAESKQ